MFQYTQWNMRSFSVGSFCCCCCDGSFCGSVRLWWGGDASGCVLHAPHAAALDGLLNLLAEGRAVAALESVFPALHPLAGAAGAGVAGAAALHPRHHACGLTDGVPSLDLVEVPHRLPVALGLYNRRNGIWKTRLTLPPPAFFFFLVISHHQDFFHKNFMASQVKKKSTFL